MLPYCLMFNMSMPDAVMAHLEKITRPVTIEQVVKDNLYQDIKIVAASPMIGFGDEWYERLPNLKLIAVFGVGLDKFNLQKARAHHVDVTTTLNILTREVTDLTFAMLLSLSRRMIEADRFVRSGEWKTGDKFPLTHSVYEKRLGIIGLGAIGHDIGQRGEAFGMQPRYYSRSPKAGVAWPYYSDIVELARDSDVLVAAVAATADTQNIINKSVFEALGKDGIFINIARGAVVDEPALIEALQNKTIASAGLDVYWNEPDINPAFFTLENTVLVPHRGSATVETRYAMGLNVVENIKAVLAGKPALTIVN